MEKFTATLLKNQVTSNSSNAHALHKKSSFGTSANQKILYSLSETFFLVQKNKMQVLDFKNNNLSENQLLRKFARLDKNFQTKYQVFKDLTEKGYSVKTALKFGADFRVYDKETKKSHSKWLCYVTHENQNLKWSDFAAKNRVAHSAKKNLLIAIVDEENCITYYEIKWTKP